MRLTASSNTDLGQPKLSRKKFESLKPLPGERPTPPDFRKAQQRKKHVLL